MHRARTNHLAKKVERVRPVKCLCFFIGKECVRENVTVGSYTSREMFVVFFIGKECVRESVTVGSVGSITNTMHNKKTRATSSSQRKSKTKNA